MTMVSMPMILFQVVGEREWYEKETISINKNGINGTIIEIGTGSFNDTTIIVNKNGLTGTTTEVT